MSEAEQISESLQGRADDVRHALRAKEIEQYTIDAVMDSYIQDLLEKDPGKALEIIDRLEDDQDYLETAHKAVYQGLVFSTLVSTLDDFVYQVALDEITEIKDPSLYLMRERVFEFGVKVACQSTGGSVTTGKTKKRLELFKTAAQLAAN